MCSPVEIPSVFQSISHMPPSMIFPHLLPSSQCTYTHFTHSGSQFPYPPTGSLQNLHSTHRLPTITYLILSFYVFMLNLPPIYPTNLYMPWRQGMLHIDLLISHRLATPSVVWSPAALTSVEVSLGMWNLKSHPRTINPKSAFKGSADDSHAH